MNEEASAARQLVPPEVAFEEFKSYVLQFDPIEILCQLTTSFLFTQEGFQGEATDTRRWARWIEFTAGYLVTVPPSSQPYKTFDGSHIEEFERLILQYFDSFLYYRPSTGHQTLRSRPHLIACFNTRSGIPYGFAVMLIRICSLSTRGSYTGNTMDGFGRTLGSQFRRLFKSSGP